MLCLIFQDITLHRKVCASCLIYSAVIIMGMEMSLKNPLGNLLLWPPFLSHHFSKELSELFGRLDNNIDVSNIKLGLNKVKEEVTGSSFLILLNMQTHKR